MSLPIFMKIYYMTMTSHVARKALIACCFAIVSASCGSARLYKGYGYTGSQHAPDMGGQQVEQDAAAVSSETAFPEAQGEELAQQQDGKTADIQVLISQAENQPTPIRELAVSALGDASRMAADGKTITHQTLAREVTSTMVASGKIQPLHPKHQQKLDKLTAKMDQKLQQQGREIDWKNNSGLELFFMIMAIAGLVLGIIGVAFGWFVFIVFAGLWLYWKLVKD
jgi:hypothetical protein